MSLNYEELKNGFKAQFEELTEREAKAFYRQLAQKYHPDKKGGDTKAMQILNKVYAEKMQSFKKEFDFEIEKILIDKINEIIKLEGIMIEVLGSWLWVTGNTLPHKEELKKAGLIFCPKKESVVFRANKDKAQKCKSNKPLLEIRKEYGSKIVKAIKRLS